jgi:hypothetical protein
MTDRVIQLALQIADSAASCDIEILCAPVGGEPSNIAAIRACWFDINQIIDPDEMQVVIKSVEYLDRRGLLKRHPTHVNWVRPRHATSEFKALFV